MIIAILCPVFPLPKQRPFSDWYAVGMLYNAEKRIIFLDYTNGFDMAVFKANTSLEFLELPIEVRI